MYFGSCHDFNSTDSNTLNPSNGSNGRFVSSQIVQKDVLVQYLIGSADFKSGSLKNSDKIATRCEASVVESRFPFEISLNALFILSIHQRSHPSLNKPLNL